MPPRGAAEPWREMRAMSNFVVHGYFDISSEVVWRTAIGNLPSLTAPLLDILSRLSVGQE